MREIVVFTGSAHPDLAQSICSYLGVPLSPATINRFSNGCLQVQLKENCRERDVFIIQPLVPPVHDHLMELLQMLDAARGASASRVTAVIPYYGYSRSDQKDAPRISIAGRLTADLLVTAGADRVLTMTLHAPQVHGFFSVPVDHLNALDILAGHFRDRDLSNTVVVSPDFGRAKDAIVLDEEIATGGSILTILDRLSERGVERKSVVCTHGLFTGSAPERFRARPDVIEFVTTDTVSSYSDSDIPNLSVLSVAPLLGEAMRRIHLGESVSGLFAGPEWVAEGRQARI